MGMYGTLSRISDRQLARITASPERVASLLSRDGPVRSKPWRVLRLEEAWDVPEQLQRVACSDRVKESQQLEMWAEVQS